MIGDMRVMLSAAKHPMVIEKNEILRFAQNDSYFVLFVVI
jgi:hypothetical protein